LNGEKKLVNQYDQKTKEKNIPNIKSFVLGSDIEEPKESVITFSHQQRIDCIFVGTRGHGALKRFLLGSFSNYIVSHAESDVMIVREYERRKKRKVKEEELAAEAKKREKEEKEEEERGKKEKEKKEKEEREKQEKQEKQGKEKEKEKEEKEKEKKEEKEKQEERLNKKT